MSFTLPHEVLVKVAALGPDGARWLEALPEVVRSLEADWRIRVGGVLAGGSDALVLEASTGDGAPAALKAGLSDLSAEARVLGAAAGRGYVAMLRNDDTRNALLLERLGAPLAESGLPEGRQIAVACDALVAAWAVSVPAEGWMTGAEKAHWLAAFIPQTWESIGPVCAEATIERAVAFARSRERAHDPATCALVHGDVHPHNLLQAPGAVDRYKLIDPDGLWAEPAYDLGVLMRDWNRGLLEGDALALGIARGRLLSARAGVDETAIWEWGFLERVSTGLYLVSLGHREEGLEFLAVADVWRGR